MSQQELASDWEWILERYWPFVHIDRALNGNARKQYSILRFTIWFQKMLARFRSAAAAIIVSLCRPSDRKTRWFVVWISSILLFFYAIGFLFYSGNASFFNSFSKVLLLIFLGNLLILFIPKNWKEKRKRT